MLHRPLRALLVPVFLLAAAGASAQTAEEIVSRNLEAKGGRERWKGIESLRMTGTMRLQGKELPLTIQSKRPNLMRHEMVLGDARVVQAFDGKRAWAVNPMTGGTPQELPAEAAEMIAASAEFDGALVDYKAKGHRVELVGKAAVNGSPVYHLRLTMKNGNVQNYFLDVETALERRVTQDVEIAPGKKQTLATEMGDYRKVDGIVVPHDVRQLLEGNVIGHMRIAKVEVNAIQDDAIFQMPRQ